MRLLIVLLSVLLSCGTSLEKEDSHTQKHKSLQIEDVISFFEYDGEIVNENIEFFIDGKEYPVISIPLGEYELSQAKWFGDKYDVEILFLDNPTNTSVDLFYKGKGLNSSVIVENKHFPDDISLSKLNDTLFVSQYYWEYDFGSDLNHIKTYYFVSKNTGILKFGYNCYGDKEQGLNLDTFEAKNDTLYIKENKGKGIIKIFSDTIIGVKTSNQFLVEPYLIYFDSLSFSRH